MTIPFTATLTPAEEQLAFRSPTSAQKAYTKAIGGHGLTVTPLLENYLRYQAPLSALPYPLEAYTTELIEYFKNLPKKERKAQYANLKKVSAHMAILASFALPELNAASPRLLFQTVPGHLYPLAISLLRGQGYDVLRLIEGRYTPVQGKKRGPLYTAFPENFPHYLDLTHDEVTDLQNTLTKERDGIIAQLRRSHYDDTKYISDLLAPLNPFEAFFQSHPQWARDFLTPIVTHALRAPSSIQHYEIYRMVRLALDLDIPLSDRDIRTLLSTWLEYLHPKVIDPSEAKDFEALITKLEHPAVFAEYYLTLKSPHPLLLPYLPAHLLESILEASPTPSMVKAMAKTPYVLSHWLVAERLLKSYPSVASILLQHGSPDVQREMIESGKYTAPLVSLLKRSPTSIHSSVPIPAPALAKVLATVPAKKRIKVLPLISRAKPSSPTP